ncbi:MFS transporter [Sphingobium sp.]|uniref:spinster family MFS transporter n=1 Tax=Sphingobium sp. TaxID=1912891 RepID=UPI0028BEFB13|nr:MFS transporter [Sphingobium sp.]
MSISFADRYVLAMLIQPIKAELHLSDSQVGLVTGFAFSAFYAVFGLLIARISDRGWHRAVILASLFVWSAMTSLSGFAVNFFQLLLARFGVGAGEAGVAPASHATLAQLFTPESRSTVLAFFSAGGPLGILTAFAVSGPLELALGWRWTFIVMGIPGALLALLFVCTVPALPTSATVEKIDASSARNVGAVALLSNRTFVYLLASISLIALLAFGIPQWLPAFFERSFNVSRATLGPHLALTQGFGMLIGMTAGGWLADRLARRNPRWRMRLVMISVVGAVPFVMGTLVLPSYSLALTCAGFAALLLGVTGGPVWSAVQEVAPAEGRATAAALAMMVSSFLGLGLGPLLIGIASDLLVAQNGQGSLRQALIIVSAIGSTALVIALRATLLRIERSASAQAVGTNVAG